MNFNFLRAIQFQPFERASGARWWGAGSHRDDSWQLSRTLLQGRCYGVPLMFFRDVSDFSKALQVEKIIKWKCIQINWTTQGLQQTHCIHGCCFQKPKNKVTVVGGWGWSMPHVTFDHMKGHVLTTLGRPARAGHRMTWSAWQKSKRAAGVGMWKHHITTYLEIIK